MHRTPVITLAVVVLAFALGAGASLGEAQEACLVAAPYSLNPPCGDPTEIDGGCPQAGISSVSVYPRNPRFTAADVCDAVFATSNVKPIYVRQRMGTDIYTWFCDPAVSPGTQCVPKGVLPADEPGCDAAGDCFCLDGAEAVQIRMATPAVVNFGGVPVPYATTLGPGGVGDIGSWWVSTPGNFATWQDYADAVCLVSTGLNRGTITCENPSTGAVTSIAAGTPQALTPFPNSYACRLRNPANICYSSQGLFPLPPLCTIRYLNDVCILGTGNGTAYRWWIDLNADGDPTGDPQDANATPAPAGSNATALAQALAASINGNAQSMTTGTFTTPPIPNSMCFTIGNFNQIPFNIWVGTAGLPFPQGNPCAITASGCVYNPTIRLATGVHVPALGTMGLIGLGVLLLAAAALLLR